MVARPGRKQDNFNSGEVTAEIWGRFGLKSYYAAASHMANVEPKPQGGFVLAPGMRWRARLGRAMTALPAVTPAPATVSAAGDLIAEIDLGAPVALAGLDLTGFTASASLTLAVTLSGTPGGGGVTLSPQLTAGLTARTRRLAFAPGMPVTGQYLRLTTAIAPSGPVTVTPGTLTPLAESFGLAARVRPFSASGDRDLVLALMPGHMDIFRDGAFVGACAFPYTADQLPDVQMTQRADTAFFWHTAVAPQRLVREAGDGEWSITPAVFRNVPNIDLGGTYTNGVPEQYDIYLTWTGSIADQDFTLDVNGETTDSISTGAASWPAVAADIQAALNALPSSAGGVTVVSSKVRGGHAEFRVTFGGASTGSANTLTGMVVSTPNAAITTGKVKKSVMPGEPIMSAARGWPSTGAFYQDRLFIGGFAAKRSAYAASQTAEYFQFSPDVAAASGPILDNLDVDGNERIVHFARSKYLVILTTGDLYFLNSRTIDRTQPRNAVASETGGAAPSVPVVTKADGGLIYASEDRTQLMAASYTAVDEGFTAESLTLLASHLIGGSTGARRYITDMARQSANDETDAMRLHVVRDDGLLITGLLIRNQDVTAYVRRVTDGKVRSVCTDGANRVHVVVERLVGGAPRLTLEVMEAGLLFDQSVTVTLPAPGMAVTGLDALEGATVWTQSDAGWIEGPHTVTGGAVTLAWPATTVTVGRWTPPRVVTLPIVKSVDGQNTVLNRPARVHTVGLDLIDTTSVAVGANGQMPRDVALQRAGMPIDAPPTPWTGERRVAGISGFSAEGLVEITQKRPGRLTLRSLTTEART